MFQICSPLDDDKQELSDVCKETFRQTYNGLFNEDDLETMFSVEQLSTEFQDQDIGYVIVKRQQRIIGYAKLEYRNDHRAYLSKFYILSIAHGQGVGKLLLKYCAEQLLAKRKTTIELWVWEKNRRAIEYYEKYDFKKREIHTLNFNGQTFFDYRMEHDVEQLLHCLMEEVV